MENRIRTLIVGAGDAGKIIVHELLTSKYCINCPVCFVDDDLNKQGKTYSNVRVVGLIDDIEIIVKKYSIKEIFICMPSVSSERQKQIYNICSKTNLKIKILPGLYQIINNKNLYSNIRDLNINDLLAREPITILDDNIESYFNNKTILITGGGGSIGSEICRQLVNMKAKQIVVLDIYENSVYDLQQELFIRYGRDVNIHVEIVSITNKEGLEKVFIDYKPNIVIMAAAHKHVPLMEHNVIEAVYNNVFGTLNTIELAEKYNVDRVHMVSTDKAVNPSSVMGVTKRLCEMICQSHAIKKQHTTFSITRFGNVLGSAGSVIPLFKKQILNGGPVTITDFRIVRFFMTIPEASQLILCSISMGKNGELFVLDMGNPVKILDLAKNMIRLSGFEPNEEIKIVETGLRPGEKLYEELLINPEKLEKTSNKLIFIEKDTPVSIDTIDLYLNRLREGVKSADNAIMKKILKQIVPTYLYKED